MDSDGYRERLAAALGRYESRVAGEDQRIETYLAQLPERVRDLARAFCNGFHRPPVASEKKYWLKTFTEQVDMGLTAHHIELAIQKMDREGLTIKSPASVVAFADDFRRRDSSKRRRRKVIVVGGTHDEKKGNPAAAEGKTG